MTAGMIEVIVIGVLILLFSIVALIYGFVYNDREMGVGVFIIGLILSLILIVVPIVYSNTPAGQRAYKDQQSNFNVNQITCEVIVYDIKGDVITGKFDIETDNEKYILFDDEDGLRHIIYYTTGTIIVNEVK